MSAFWLAWVLPAVTGATVVLAFEGKIRRGRIARALGYGVIFGLLLAAAIAAATSRSDTTHAWLLGTPWMISMAVIATLVTLWRFVRHRRLPNIASGEPAPVKVAKWKLLLVAFAMVSLVVRAWISGREILLRPTFPWDAWDAWAVKSKTWFLLGHYAPFVAMPRWLSHASGEMFTGPAWSYPATLAWVQVWFASAAGEWIEPLVNLPWLALWIGLLLGHYGQWRALGMTRVHALAFMYVLGSLPLLDTHVALAGYADLWVATLFGFAMLAWLRWLEQRDRSQLVLALLCAMTLPLLKQEGAVWAACLLAVIGVGFLPTRWRWRVSLGSVVIVIVFLALGGLRLPFVIFGWLRSGTHAIELPVVGSLALHWHSAALAGIGSSLFLQPNWHLLWCLVPLVVVLRWRALRDSNALCLLALLLSLCFCLLLFLFVLTDAAQWAESYTAVNRLVMHITPGVVTLLALLFRQAQHFPAPSGIASGSGPQPVPG